MVPAVAVAVGAPKSSPCCGSRASGPPPCAPADHSVRRRQTKVSAVGLDGRQAGVAFQQSAPHRCSTHPLRVRHGLGFGVGAGVLRSLLLLCQLARQRRRPRLHPRHGLLVTTTAISGRGGPSRTRNSTVGHCLQCWAARGRGLRWTRRGGGAPWPPLLRRGTPTQSSRHTLAPACWLCRQRHRAGHGVCGHGCWTAKRRIVQGGSRAPRCACAWCHPASGMGAGAGMGGRVAGRREGEQEKDKPKRGPRICFSN